MRAAGYHPASSLRSGRSTSTEKQPKQMADEMRLIRDPDEPGSVLVQINPPQARLTPPTPPHLPPRTVKNSCRHRDSVE